MGQGTDPAGQGNGHGHIPVRQQGTANMVEATDQSSTTIRSGHNTTGLAHEQGEWGYQYGGYRLKGLY
jgi:hypothetical protein